MSQINVNVIAPLGYTGPALTGNNNNVKIINSAGNGLFIDGGPSVSHSMKITDYAAGVVGTNNTYMGWGCGVQLNLSGMSNTFFGNQAGYNVTGGSNNVLLGSSTGPNVSTGVSNVMVGAGAGSGTTTANDNVFLGNNAGMLSTSGNNNICIGTQSYTATASSSDSITLGNLYHSVLRCAVTSITSLSDARDKKEVKDLNVGLDFIDGLRPVTFVWDDRDENGKHDIADFGFIAQDLKAAENAVDMSEVLKLVYDENPEKLEASYGKLIPILVKAVQELSAEVKQLKSKKK
jgi:hypothetical protein